MFRPMYPFAGVLMIVLASISGYGQTRSRRILDLADHEGPRVAGTQIKSARRIANVPLRVVSPQPDIPSTSSFFDHSAVWSASPAEGTFVQIQAAPSGASWPQWGQNPEHTGFLNIAGQNLNRILANIVYDTNVPDETAQNGGNLLAHYQAPLVESNDVYMEFKGGNYTVANYATQSWGENKFTWQGKNLVQAWSFASDWVAPGSANDFWEPVFHAALANGSIYVPGAGGTIFRVNKANGGVEARINPFSGIDAHTYTVSPLTVDSSGNIFYNVLKTHDSGVFYQNDAVDSWLVKVSPNNSVVKVSYSVLTPGAKSTNDLCENSFADSQLPWPPSPTSVAGSVPCGTQRVAINIAPAVAPDGTIYSVTRAHFISRWGYLVAVNPNLTPKWIASLHDNNGVGYFHDGCNDGTPASAGSILPLNGTPGGCRAGANPGVDPATNRFGGGRVLDDSSSTPTIASDGSIFYGSYTRYNYAQGHMMHFSAAGQFLGAFGFGWDTTPGVFQHDGTYSLIIKNNHYGEVGSYCNDPVLCPEDRTASNPASPEEYFITQLSPSLDIEWSFKNTNTLSCTRNPNGSVTCVDDHPNSFEWCVNAFVIDSNGVVYVNSEDGNLFAIFQGGTLKQKIFQQLALGAAYTPTSLGSDGKIYSQNAGRLFVVGK